MKQIKTYHHLTVLLAFYFFFEHGEILAQTTVFSYTGTAQSYVVPPCVTTIDLDVKGAQGSPDGGGLGSPGNGGRIQATISVTPGDTLFLYVGGSGSAPAGGYNGGGNGGTSVSGPFGGGGGGASDIRQGDTTINNRIIIAGGGGGCGGYNGIAGGHGGDLTGQNGTSGAAGGGSGGTQSTGGSGGGGAGSCGLSGASGGIFSGGNGGNTTCGSGFGGGGGAGGGYYGGGGGGAAASLFCCPDWSAGGGGGSGYALPSATNVIFTSGYQTGNGEIVITANPSSPSTPDSISGPNSVCSGASFTYSINPVSGATSYTWSVLSGTTINSGQGTTSINVTFGTTSDTITVTADNSCSSSPAQILIINVTNLTATSSQINPASCTGCCDGSANATASGGTLPYTYSWDDPASQTDSTATGLCAGTYIVTVTDGNGCQETDTVIVTEPTGTITIKGINYDVQVFPNPFEEQAILTILSYREGQVLTLYNILGEEVRQVAVTGQQTVINRENLQSGIYFYEIKNGSQRLATGKLILH